MTSTSDESSARTACERLFADFLERHHEHGADPEQLFASNPDHEPTLRRWWQRLVAVGEVVPAPAGERFGRFVLLEELGAGAQGRVHLALDPHLGRRIALKMLPNMRAVQGSAIERFRREAAVAARLQHPGICTVYEAGEHDGIAYIAMRYVDGETLADRLASARTHGESMPIDEALRIVEGAAWALHAAHEAGLVHRDVKPGNVMIDPDGQPVVLDFGLASDAQDPTDLTRTGDLLGTPSYMSPEQIHGACGAPDRRTDVWSLGVVLYECLTLHTPFEAPTQQLLRQRILTAPVPDPRKWRADLGRESLTVLATALAKDRTHRYATAADLAEDLRRLRQRESVIAQAIGPLRRLWRWSRTRPVLATSLAAIAAATLTATTIVWLLYVEAEAARMSFGQLADGERLRIARIEAARLQPVTPALASRLADWLELHGEPLAARLELHRDALASLRGIGRPREVVDEFEREHHPDMPRLNALRALRDQWTHNTETLRHELVRQLARLRADAVEPEIERLEANVADHRVIEFDDREDTLRHRLLTEFVTDLDRFVGPGGVLAEMRDRLAWARSVESSTVGTHADAWRRAAEAVSREPRYGERSLAPQLGLVPLGADPHSGLQEFAFARGGSVPVRDTVTGGLLLDASSAPVLVLVPPGTFTMGALHEPGSPNHDSHATDDETPAIAVPLDWYLIGKHELSAAQWRRLAADHAGDFAFQVGCTVNDGTNPDLRPVTDIAWFRSVEVLTRHDLWLPTEAQWEYAARGGTTTMFWTGPEWRSLVGAANVRDDEAGTGPAWIDDGYRFTAPVHALRPNAFGLHQTAGNAVEWCRESYSRQAYELHPPRPGDGLMSTPKSNSRSVRGGSFLTRAFAGRSAARGSRPANIGYPEVGVRVARYVTP